MRALVAGRVPERHDARWVQQSALVAQADEAVAAGTGVDVVKAGYRLAVVANERGVCAELAWRRNLVVGYVEEHLVEDAMKSVESGAEADSKCLSIATRVVRLEQ